MASQRIKEAVKKTVGRKKVGQLVETARLKLWMMLEELKLPKKQMENQMVSELKKTNYVKLLLSIKRISVMTLVACLGELGNPTRFEKPWQISYMAGYNLMEDRWGRTRAGRRHPNMEEKTC